MGYGIFQVIETSPIICHIPYPMTPSTIVLNTLVEHFVSMSGVNTMHTGWWVGENSEGRPSGSVVGVGCLPSYRSWLLLEYEDDWHQSETQLPRVMSTRRPLIRLVNV